LTFTGAKVTNSLTFTRAANAYAFNDPLDPITLGPGALAAGFTVTGGGARAAGPAAPVSALALNLGSGANTVTLGPFDAAAAPLAVAGGGNAGRTATLAAG